MPPKAKNWCFNVDHEPQLISNLHHLCSNDDVEYLIFSMSSSPPTIEGVVKFKTKKRTLQITSLIGQCRLHVSRDVVQSVKNCRQLGCIRESGCPPLRARPGLKQFKSSVEVLKTGATKLKALFLMLHPELYLHPGYASYMEEYVLKNTNFMDEDIDEINR
jgi:hypothetical protein